MHLTMYTSPSFSVPAFAIRCCWRRYCSTTRTLSGVTTFKQSSWNSGYFNTLSVDLYCTAAWWVATTVWASSWRDDASSWITTCRKIAKDYRGEVTKNSQSYTFHLPEVYAYVEGCWWTSGLKSRTVHEPKGPGHTSNRDFFPSSSLWCTWKMRGEFLPPHYPVCRQLKRSWAGLKQKWVINI